MTFLRRSVEDHYDYLLALAKSQMPLEAIGAKMGYPADEWKVLCEKDPLVMRLVDTGRQEGIGDMYQTLFDGALGRGGRDRDARLFQILLETYLGISSSESSPGSKPKYKALSEDKLKQIHAIVSGD